MTDFLVIGESVADIVRTPGGPDVPHPGGSPANVAYGLARLGHDTALLTQLGADAMGELIGAHLRSAGVRLLSDGEAGVRTPTAVVTLDAEGRAAYDFDIAWTLRPVPPPVPPLHVHLGSIAAVREPGAAVALAMVSALRGRASVSYDPNIRPELMGARAEAVVRVERWVTLSDVVKASDEDVAWLHPGRSLRDVAERWLTLGPAMVLITCGADGALAFSRSGSISVAATRTTVVDTVGAGDAFMSAALDGLASLGLLGDAARPGLATVSVATAGHLLAHAGAAAALTVSRAGANPPDAAELGRMPAASNDI